MNIIKVIKTDGIIEEIKMEKQPTLEQMQEWVGGYVEKTRVWPMFGEEMYVDEDGLSKNLPKNFEASAFSGQPIVGDAVIFENFKCARNSVRI